MKRRSFIRTLLAGCVAPMFLPGGGRIWKATPQASDFVDLLNSQLPLYDAVLMAGAWKWVVHDLADGAVQAVTIG